MNNLKEQFLKYICQTSDAPIGMEIVRAAGCKLYDNKNQEYLDCISGIAVANVGHNHPEVQAAIHAQVDKYSHVMVYGEYFLEPQIAYARSLAEIAPGNLSVTFFTNSGAEAIEGALKTAKKLTGRPNICAFENSYHGDTMGALSVMGSEIYR
ncbi:MAG: aminotransferase class III-fold pyridoxal phosphate-dependent enzyme, partial [Patescibacteria group bacterium]|nr:aminotransferase class III-fold pyridoxal phosphate-dependent enzyme [Patescibacteria group bacterium]